MEKAGRESNDGSFTSVISSSKTYIIDGSPTGTGETTPTDRQTTASTDSTISETKDNSAFHSESDEKSTSIHAGTSKGDGNLETESMPVNAERVHETTDSRQKLGFTPPLERPKDPTVNSIGIIQELRKDGFLGCSTPLIPRNTRQTKSGISFEYYFRPHRDTPRLLPRLKSDGNIGKTISKRNDVPRRESPLKKNAFRRKSPLKSCRWHTGCRAAIERRRLQREVSEQRSTQDRDDWKVIGQFWQDLRQKKERERMENEERRMRERKILNELMGRSSKDPLP